jgi:hypothetical protein
MQLSSRLRETAERLHSGGEGSTGVGILDLIDWTMETAKELRTPNDFTSIGSATSGEAIMKPEQPMPISGLDTEIIADHPETSEWPSTIEPAPAAPQPVAPVTAADLHATLLQAIVDPGIHTSKADRHRAIDLRWLLRDIAAGRLRASPIRQLDLQLLIDMKLIELRDGVPHLTNAGATII